MPRTIVVCLLALSALATPFGGQAFAGGAIDTIAGLTTIAVNTPTVIVEARHPKRLWHKITKKTRQIIRGKDTK